MTASQILAQVEAQFQVMYLSPEQRAVLLAQALRVCQAKTGPFTDITFEAGTVDTPGDFLSVAVAMDKNGRWQEVRRLQTAAIPADGETPEVPATDKLQIVGFPVAPEPVEGSAPLTIHPTAFNSFYGQGRVANTSAVAPFTLVYFIDLNKSVQIPPMLESQLYGYLSILLEIPNNKRAREVATTMGMQAEFPSDEELKQRKDLMEVEMEESQSIIPSAAVF